MSKLTKALTAAAGNAGGDNLYVEDVFSTYLYTGNGSNGLAIDNGIDLAGEGGLVWIKSRGSENHSLATTDQGLSNQLASNLTNGNIAWGNMQSFNSDGFTLTNAGTTNTNTVKYASWTFRKAEKFFDVVTYTGNGTTQSISHNLGSTPGVIIVKNTQSSTYWAVYHGSVPAYVGFLNATNAFDTSNTQNFGNNTNPVAPTDSVFTVGQQSTVNSSGETYVAYLFASDAGGFGDDGSENSITCSSFTVSSGSASVTLGYEPQFVIVKAANGTGNWLMFDTMRGMGVGTNVKYLQPNTSNAEGGGTDFITPTATGFEINNLGGTQTFIYMAIRRPMKTPETGTEVFAPKTRSGSGAIVTTGAGFTPDVFYNFDRTYGGSNGLFDRLRGRGILQTMSTAVENATSPAIYDLVGFDTMDGVELGGAYNINMTGSGRNFVDYYFKRATGFMDVVIETATQSLANPATEHNLGVVPEFMISKSRDSSASWFVYHSALGLTKYLDLSSSNAYQSYNVFGTTLTSTQFQYYSQASGESIVNYLFATVAGVSKVGSYTGTGSDLNVDCGFSAGARWVMIKRSDISDGVSNAGDWFIWDSSRGISASTDPYVLANSSAAEVTNTDYIDPLSSGFTVTSSAPNSLNKSGGSYIFLAIA